MSKTRYVLGIAVLLGLAAIVVAIPASGAVTHLAIESATPSVEDPAPGETFTVSVTVANRASGTGPVEVTDIYIRNAGSASEHARVEDMGTILAGESLSVPIRLSFDNPGTKRLTVHARVEDDSGTYRTVTYPLTVDVQLPDEAMLSFDDPDPVAGEEGSVTVSIANGAEGPISNARLELGGDASVENPERVTAAIETGTQVSYTYEVTFPEAGTRTLEGTLSYRTEAGKVREISRDISVNVERTTVDPELTATATTANGTSGIRVSLSEYGNAELRDVEVQALVDGALRTRSTLPDVSESETQTTVLDGTSIGPGNVTVLARYTAAGTEHNTSAQLQYAPTDTASVVLSGVDLTHEAGTAIIDGDTANLGSLDVHSVLVEVVDSAGVDPVAPNRDYFVGGIQKSEFGTFELTANISDGVDSIPVRVSYSADGERHSHVTPVAVDRAALNGESGEETNSGLPLVLIALGGALVALVGTALYRWMT